MHLLIFIVDTNNNVLKKIDMEGNTQSLPVSLSLPMGLDIDKERNFLYICEKGDNRIVGLNISDNSIITLLSSTQLYGGMLL